MNTKAAPATMPGARITAAGFGMVRLLPVALLALFTLVGFSPRQQAAARSGGDR